ncbi:hypothetical protein CUMW_241030 [Citrus unshiu]|uniref:Organ specific protein n=1 Tax=Citrus unshiu TaxID=55188 RepID=A0A2H5QLC7_CITUN|nr:hypothetical protein CUMW_241030 [Citrus unshiu]
MKSIFASSIIISLLLFASLGYARKEPGDYWKSIMKDKPMPKALKDLFPQADERMVKMDHFVKDFDRKSSSVSIIYHRRSEPETEKQKHQEDKSLKTEPKFPSAYTQEAKENSNQLHN